MANINKIRLSGQTYNIQDENATKTVELTQAQYDALTVKDPNTFYIITDSQGADLSNYYTKSETSGATEISTALNAKQDTLVSGTNIKTINNENILGSGNINIQGGGSSYTAGDGIDITNDVISVTGKVDTSTFNTYTAATATAIGNKLATSDFNTYSGTVDTAINSKASQSDLSTLSGTVTAHTANTDIHVTTAQTAAWDTKSDFSGSYNDLTDKPTIPTSASQLTNDVGYLVANDITGKTDTSAFTAHTSDSDIHVTSSEKSTWNAKSDFSGSYNDLADKPTLFSGDYNDLTNKPTIPTVPTSNTAFTNDAGYITSDAISGKADTSAVTESINAAVSGKVDTSTFNTYSGSVETALSGKQDTLSAGTGIEISGNVISATGGGGGMTEDDELLLSTALVDLNDRKADKSLLENYQMKGDYVTTSTLNTRLADYETALDEQNVEEVTAYALNDLNNRVTDNTTALGGMKLVKITESEYAALTTKDENTLYIVVADPS